MDGLTLPVPLAVFRVDADYLTTLRRPVLRGRDFPEIDMSGAPAVPIVINEIAAAALPLGADPIGRQIAIPQQKGHVEVCVAGVVGDLSLEGHAARTEPALYVLHSYPVVRSLATVSRMSRGEVSLQMRTRGDRSVLAALDRNRRRRGRARGDAMLALRSIYRSTGLWERFWAARNRLNGCRMRPPTTLPQC